MWNMDLIGFIDNIVAGAARVDKGRKGLSTNGEEHQGRLYYEEGFAIASNTFSQVASTADPRILLLVEEAFVEQELRFCGEKDTYTRSSLTQAIHSFDDAFLCLEAVENMSGYKVANNTWPHNSKYRIRGYPKDAFHIACTAHRTRLHNILRSPGINMLEKTVLEQRIANMTAAQAAYTEKQKKTLSDENASV